MEARRRRAGPGRARSARFVRAGTSARGAAQRRGQPRQRLEAHRRARRARRRPRSRGVSGEHDCNARGRRRPRARRRGHRAIRPRTSTCSASNSATPMQCSDPAISGPADDEIDPVRTYVPSSRPGVRLPHGWIRRDGAVCSTLDLIPLDRPVLIAGRTCDIADVDLRVGVDFEDPDDWWSARPRHSRCRRGLGPPRSTHSRPMDGHADRRRSLALGVTGAGLDVERYRCSDS